MLEEIHQEFCNAGARQQQTVRPISGDQPGAAQIDLSKVLEAFEEHTRHAEEHTAACYRHLEEHTATSLTAFRNISKTVLQEVRKGWVEAGSLFCSPPSRVEMSGSYSTEANLLRLLQPLEEHAAASRAAVEDMCKSVCSDSSRHGGQGVDFSEVLVAIREMQSKVDLSEILEATDKIRRDIKLELSDMKPLLHSAHSVSPGHAPATYEVPPPAELGSGVDALSTLHQVSGLGGLEERLLSKVSSEHKLALIELHKILTVLDGIMDMSSSQLDLSPVLDAIARLDMQPAEVNFNSVFRTMTEISGSIAAAQVQLSQAGKLPTQDDLIDLRQVVLANLRDLAVNCEQLQGKVDNLEERLISRMSSNHKVAMSELQKATNVHVVEAC